MPKPILAAGAVLWRFVEGSSDIEVALIHRPRYNDWSLPKGKLNSGETEPAAAVREVHEETGQHSHLGRALGVVRYPVLQGIKRVRYWASHAIGGEFAANDEVDEMLWTTLSDAIGKVSYPHDRKILRRFKKVPPNTKTVLIVRHGTAGRKKRYKGDDRKRPLDKHGRAQAELLVGQLLAFGPTKLYSCPRVRCIQTIEPLADELGTEIKIEPTLTEEAYSVDRKAARQRVLQIASEEGTPVIASQGKVIPDLIQWWCDRDGVKPAKARNGKGSTWVLSLLDGKVVAADHLVSPLPPD
jgi:8-oxo-(d)GTP phosphatase